MGYLGFHWNAVALKWEGVRTNLDGMQVPKLPALFVKMYSEAVQRANRELQRAGKKRKLTGFPEGAPTIGVANFYSGSASMQSHQDKTESKASIEDKTESKASIEDGYPVMGVCIGESCDFVYSNEP